MAALLVGCLSTEKKKKLDKNSVATNLTQDRNSSNPYQKTSNANPRRKHHKELAEDNEVTILHQRHNNQSSEGLSSHESEDMQGSAAVNFPLLAKSLKTASFDFLLPLNIDNNNLVFSQVGARRYEGKNIINFGVGQRHFFDKWMLGYNSFYDRQISGNQHQRLSVGLELWKDYFKFSSNSYHRISGWKPSAHSDQTDERVANGYDLRLEAALPSYPQLSGKLKYEQYFGNQVATINRHELYDNPSAFTLGMSYTPFPLVSLGLEHSRWNNGNTDNKLNLSFNYQINVPLSKQLDSRMMPQFRTLSTQRLDLVDRNHNIVLEHKDNKIRDEIKLALPTEFRGFEGERKQVILSVTSKYEIEHIQWNATNFISSGGKIIKNSPIDYQIQLPKFSNQSINQFVIIATAYDKKGNASNPSQMTIYNERYAPAQLEKNISSSLPLNENVTKEQLADPIDILEKDEVDEKKLKFDKYDSHNPTPDEVSIDTDDTSEWSSGVENDDHTYDSVHETVMDEVSIDTGDTSEWPSDVENDDHTYDSVHKTVMDEDGDSNKTSHAKLDDDNPSSEESNAENAYDSDYIGSEDENNNSKPLLTSSFTEEDKFKLNDTLKNMSEEAQKTLADKLSESLKSREKTNIQDDIDYGYDENLIEMNIDTNVEPESPPQVTSGQQKKSTVIQNDISEIKGQTLMEELKTRMEKRRVAMATEESSKNDSDQSWNE
ncbi:inverse autotransporter beta domain-containing protein [Sodalis sp. dw_96]|uniref:inverse autotransporter beta domain-containing protein n=1 Tax=Sodalis sp. dw_96 TaxID=2719794 RepID=UPI001BD1D4D4|nr:inverse autotransporter beta domain-containing protein [Sodalis sp. dw_96]